MNLDEFFAAVGPILTGERGLETLDDKFTTAAMRAVATYEAICRKRRADVLSTALPQASHMLTGVVGVEAWNRLVEGFFLEGGAASPAPLDSAAGFVAFLRRHAARGAIPTWLSELADLEWAGQRAAGSPDPPATLPPDEGPLRPAATVEVLELTHDLVAWLDQEPNARATLPRCADVAIAFWRDRGGVPHRRPLAPAELLTLRAIEGGAAGEPDAVVVSRLRAVDLLWGAAPAARDPLATHGSTVVLAPLAEPEPPSRDAPVRDRYSALVEIVRLLLSEHDPTKAAEILFRRVLDLTEASRGFLVVRDGDELVERLDFHQDRGAAPAEERRLCRSIVRRAIDARETIFCEDVSADPRFAHVDSIERAGARAVLVVPLHHRDDVYGALYLERTSPERSFSPDAVAFMSDFAEIAGLFLRRAVERDALRRRTEGLERDLLVDHGHGGIVTRDPRMLELLRTVCRVADSDATVLVHGETGTGKELVVRALHMQSPRRHKPIVVLHTTALPATVLESELFGHVRGAFTGADRDRAGRIASAQGGTLLLDEVAEIPLEMQAKLLRFLQFGEMQRLGSDRVERVDVRVIAATHQDLRQLVATGRFRQDLYYRLKVIQLELPPLRERKGDLGLLVDDFTKRFSRGKVPPRFTARAMARLEAHDWPGNVRELLHVVEHACVVARGPELDLDALPPELIEAHKPTRPPAPSSVAPPAQPKPPGAAPHRFTSEELEVRRESALAAAEREFLQALFDRCEGNVSRASRQSGIHRSYLQRLMARHGIKRVTSS